MKTKVDPWADTGVVALDQDELTAIRGGGPWFIAIVGGIVAGVTMEFLSHIDDYVEGVVEGFKRTTRKEPPPPPGSGGG